MEAIRPAEPGPAPWDPPLPRLRGGQGIRLGNMLARDPIESARSMSRMFRTAMDAFTLAQRFLHETLRYPCVHSILLIVCRRPTYQPSRRASVFGERGTQLRSAPIAWGEAPRVAA
jgi:hypothetical protein